MIENQAQTFNAATPGFFSHFAGMRAKKSSDAHVNVGTCAFFDNFPEQPLSQLLKLASLKKYSPGEHITRAASPSLASFFVILSGNATVYANDMSLGLVHGGECIGEGIFIENKRPTMATVVANTQVVALEVTKQAVDSLSDEIRLHIDKALVRALFKKLQRSNVLNELLHKQWVTSLWKHS